MQEDNKCPDNHDGRSVFAAVQPSSSTMNWINFQHPSEFRSTSTARAVRSHVTARQHRLERIARSKHHEGSKTDDKERKHSDQDAAISTLLDRKEQPNGSVLLRYRALPLHATGTHRMTKSSSASRSSSTSRDLTRRIPPQVPNQAIQPCDSVFNMLESYLHTDLWPSTMPAMNRPRSDSQIISSWMQPWYAAEPAILNGLLLLVAPRFKSPDLITYLHSATVSSILDALDSSERRSHPRLILAIGELAMYECLFEDIEIARTLHRPAQRKLIEEHGGSDNVEMPELVRKLIQWGETVVDMKMGHESDLYAYWVEEGGVVVQDDGPQRWEPRWAQALRMWLGGDGAALKAG